MVLRGGKSGPNYDVQSVEQAVEQLANAGLNPRLMVDCSHANANKQHKQQSVVLGNVAEQLKLGSRNILGVMIESHIKAGRQPIPENLDDLGYGQSITDACLSWEDSIPVLEQLADAVRRRRRT